MSMGRNISGIVNNSSAKTSLDPVAKKKYPTQTSMGKNTSGYVKINSSEKRMLAERSVVGRTS